MRGDNMTPDPLFNNIPRRARSAAATSVTCNTRFSSTDGAEHVPRAKKHRVAPTEEPEPKYAKDGRGVAGALDRQRHGMVGGRMPLAVSHKDKATAAAAASASSSSDSEPDVDWAENKRWLKGKTPVVNDEDNDAFAAVARRRRPPAGSGLSNKLMGDAIRSHRGSTAAVAGGFEPSSRTTKANKPAAKRKPRAKPKKEKATKKKDSGAWFWCGIDTGTSSAGSDADYSFDRIGVVSDRLRTTLSGLGVGVAGAGPGPVRVYGKLLSASDRRIHQARLLMSCKRWAAHGAEFPICAFLTEEERTKAHGDDGLVLTAYDHGGDAYELKYRYLESNGGCRLISKWSDFLKHNGLVIAGEESPAVGDEVMLDLWMFRQPGGNVGMVMLHYRSGDAAHADPVLEEVRQKKLEEEEQKSRQLMLNNGDAIMEDVVGDSNEVAGVNGAEEEAAAAPAPSSPSSSEPSGGGGGAPGEVAATATSSSPSEPDDGAGAMASAKEQAGALGEVADHAPSSTSSELPGGGAGRSEEVLSSLGGDGTEEEQPAGGVLMVMVLEVEAVAQSSLDSNAAGGEANEVAAPPSSPEEAGGGAAVMATEDAAAAELEAAARAWNVTLYEYQAALGLVMLSKANTNS